MLAKKTDAFYYPALGGVFALFLFLVFFRLTFVPGAIDEIWITTDALIWANSNVNQYLTIPFFLIRKISIPSMTCFYTGTLPNFIQIPFFYLFDPSYFSIRIGFIILAALGLLSLNYCLRHWLGKWTALFVVFLTITDTMYIRAIRRGSEHEELLIINLLWIGLAFFTLRFNTSKSRYLAGVGLIWGIAVWSKLHMVAYIAGIVLTCLIFRKQPVIKQFFLALKDFVIFSIAFIIGCLPMINFYITQNDTLQKACGTFLMYFDPTRQSPNLNIHTKLIIRLKQFLDFTKETSVNEWLHLRNIAFPSLAVMLIIFIAVYPFLRRHIAVHRQTTPLAAGIIITYALVFLSLFFNPSSVNSSHILAMLLLFELIAGIFILVVVNSKPKTRAVLALIFLTTLTHTLINRYTLMQDYYRSLIQAEEYVQWTKAIIDKAQYISKDSTLYFTTETYALALAAQWYGQKTVRRKTSLQPIRTELLEQDFYILTDTKDPNLGKVIFENAKPFSGKDYGYILIKSNSDNGFVSKKNRPLQNLIPLVTAQEQ